MLEKAIKLAKSIINLDVYDINEDEKSEDGTIDLSSFFGKRIMKFAEKYKNDSLEETLTEFIKHRNELNGPLNWELEDEIVIAKFCDKKSAGEITIK